MKYKKKIIKYLLSIVLIMSLFYIGNKINNKIEWLITKDVIAGSAYPVEAGITNSTLIKCFTTGSPPTCEGGTLCLTLDSGRCLMYSDVTGMGAYAKNNSDLQSDFNIAMAGVTNLLLSNIAIAQAGLTPGGQLIAGCMSPVLCDSGVLASAGGCYNCMAKADWKDEIKKKADYLFKYIIAGFKN